MRSVLANARAAERRSINLRLEEIVMKKANAHVFPRIWQERVGTSVRVTTRAFLSTYASPPWSDFFQFVTCISIMTGIPSRNSLQRKTKSSEIMIIFEYYLRRIHWKLLITVYRSMWGLNIISTAPLQKVPSSFRSIYRSKIH